MPPAPGKGLLPLESGPKFVHVGVFKRLVSVSAFPVTVTEPSDTVTQEWLNSPQSALWLVATDGSYSSATTQTENIKHFE